MQTWDYRIIDHGTHLGLHEVAYRRDGTIQHWSRRPLRITVRPEEGREGIVELLAAAMESAARRPILKLEQIERVGHTPVPEAARLVDQVLRN